MNLVDWLKGLAERQPDGDGKAPAARRATPSVQRPRRGGGAYAKEWVKVLEESVPGRDAFNTYTWELNPDGSGPTSAEPAAAQKAPAKPASPDPFDTYTWELQEGDSAEDPWGLSKTGPMEKTPKKDGVNPYDTGVFDASWTGKFDQR